MDQKSLGFGVHVAVKDWNGTVAEILTPRLVEIISQLHRKFSPERKRLLLQRKELQATYDRGTLPSYLDEGSAAVSSQWQVAPIPADLLCRRVEITGPVHSAKMVIQMLGRNEEGVRADMAMLDFEDSMKPNWQNVLSGFKNVQNAVEGTLSYSQPAQGKKPAKTYHLNPEDMATLMVRCRGLHLEETHLLVDGEAVPAGLFDLSVCVFLTAKTLLKNHKTPKYYIPKCEHYLEARWWNGVLSALEDAMNFSQSTLRATFLIETLPAALQMEEILYEVRSHAVGLNVGRWDKIFSDIKILKKHAECIMPDRGTITMKKPWMDHYAKRLIKICHSRGAFAMGGMAAFTPGKTPELREKQTQKVLEDKRYENEIGHDGCWVSHPYFIGAAMECFPQRNQLHQTLEGFPKYPNLIPVGQGPRTMQGLRTNIRVGIAYLEGWNRGEGCVAWDNLMEDLATLEISRAQTWQWLHHKVMLEEGKPVTKELVKELFQEELEKIHQEMESQYEGSSSNSSSSGIGSGSFELRKLKEDFRKAKEQAEELFLREELLDFLSCAEIKEESP